VRSAALAVLAALVAPPVAAQWLELPTPGLPRTADGKPDLTAAAPKLPDGKPDLSGIWQRTSGRYYNNIAADLSPEDVQPWADALHQQRRADFGKDAMEVQCLPLGPVAPTTPYAHVKIVQTPTLIVMLIDDLTYRQIHMDGRQLPVDPNPSWMGYSVGRWEGDALVVESSGFTERVWLDYEGHPHTEALRMVERYRRRDVGHLDLDVTFEDPGAYNRSWTVSVPLELYPDTELLEYVCDENEKSTVHMTSNSAGQSNAPVAVARETLAKYAGTYEIPSDDKVTTVVVSLANDGLYMDYAEGGPEYLVPMSDTDFSLSGTAVHFAADDQGTITRVVINTVEFEETAIRKTNEVSR
jgi:hypothetical protein